MIYFPLHAKLLLSLCSRWGNHRKPVRNTRSLQLCLLASDATRGWVSDKQGLFPTGSWVRSGLVSFEWHHGAQLSPAPRPTLKQLFIKYHFNPVYGRGGCRSSSLLSASCSTVHILEVPRDYVTALWAWLHFTTILLADDNAEVNQLSSDRKADCILASAFHQTPHETPRWPAVLSLVYYNRVG